MCQNVLVHARSLSGKYDMLLLFILHVSRLAYTGQLKVHYIYIKYYNLAPYFTLFYTLILSA